MKEKIKVLARSPGGQWAEKEIRNTLEGLQAEVGGYIEAVTIASNAAVICNEDGRLQGLPYNCRIMGVDFVGPILIVGSEEDEFTDCPISLAAWNQIWNPGKGAVL